MTNFSPREAPKSPGKYDELEDAESIRFARGFHDIFISIGLVLLFIGLGVAAQATKSTAITYSISAVVAWVLAEYLVHSKRLVLPGIVLASAFVYFAGAISAILFVGTLYSIAGVITGNVGIVFSGAALTASIAFYFRFRLPFALGVMAAAATLLFIASATSLVPKFADDNLALLFLLSGLAVFFAAMRFDLSDPKRSTLRADNAFWLHLLAAPILVHALLSYIPLGEGGSGDIGGPLAVLGAIFALALVALLIDRRALLVAGLGYLGIAISALLQEATDEIRLVLATTLLILGAGVVILGVAWRSTRSFLLNTFPLPQALQDQLPSTK